MSGECSLCWGLAPWENLVLGSAVETVYIIYLLVLRVSGDLGRVIRTGKR